MAKTAQKSSKTGVRKPKMSGIAPYGSLGGDVFHEDGTRSVPIDLTTPDNIGAGGGAPLDPAVQADNIRLHGFKSPFDQYVFGGPTLPLSAVALEWHLSPRTVRFWAERGEWRQAKSELLKTTLTEYGGEVVTELLETERRNHIEREKTGLETMLNEALSRVVDLEEDVVVPGVGIQSAKKGSASFKADVATVLAIYNAYRVMLSMPTTAPKQQAESEQGGATVNDNRVQIVMNVTGDRRTAEMVKAAFTEGADIAEGIAEVVSEVPVE